MLAPSPKQFRYSNNIIRHEFTTRSDYVMTNKGIRLEAMLGKIFSRQCFILNCYKQAASGQKQPYVLFVRKIRSDLYQIYQPIGKKFQSELDLEELPVELLNGTPQRFYVE